MPGHSSGDKALEVAYHMGQIFAAELQGVSSEFIMKCAILAAREVAGLSPEVAAQAIDLTHRLAMAPLDQAGSMARMTIISAREMEDLPPLLRSKASIVLGEIAFNSRDALAAIDWLAQNQHAVVGVECFEAVEGKWGVQCMGISRYERACNETGWASYVACCAVGAKDFIEGCTDTPLVFNVPDVNIVFNLAWMHEEEQYA